MKYTNREFSDAMSVISSRRRLAELNAEKRKADFVSEHPELLVIEKEMSKTGLDAIRAIQGCDDPKKYIENLKNKNLGFQKARKDLLEACGLDENYLRPDYTCKKCNDTGFVDGTMCECLEKLLKNSSFEALAKQTPLKISKFDDFKPSVQQIAPAKEQAEKILNFCKEYSEDFDLNSESLYLYGETGLGKTHISLAIAGVVIEKGFSVVYGSAQNLFSMMEREHFGKSDVPDGTTEEKLLCCDLLILDDLGAEFTTQFIVAQLFNIIDSRLAKGLPTIINSNVPINELEEKYKPRTTSRIMGEYRMIEFIGNDVRQIKG